MTYHSGMTGSEFSERLSALMDERGMNRADLSRATNIPYHRLNPWFIRPGAKASSADLLEVASFFGVSERYLLEGGQRDPFSPESGAAAEREIARLVSLLPDHLRRQLLGYAAALAESQDPASPIAAEDEQ